MLYSSPGENRKKNSRIVERHPAAAYLRVGGTRRAIFDTRLDRSRMIKIARGLDLPIEGEPAQTIDSGPRVQRVALLGDDYVGMKPTMAVETVHLPPDDDQQRRQD